MAADKVCAFVSRKLQKTQMKEQKLRPSAHSSSRTRALTPLARAGTRGSRSCGRKLPYLIAQAAPRRPLHDIE